MNIANLIASIEQNRSVIDAQVQATGALAPRPMQIKAESAAAQEPGGSLLQQVMLGQAQNATDVLAVLAKVESRVRRSFTGAAQRDAKPADANVIDVEAVEVTEPSPSLDNAT